MMAMRYLWAVGRIACWLGICVLLLWAIVEVVGA